MASNEEKGEKNDGQDVAEAEAMTVAQLKDELRRRKLKTTGNKADLVERFRAAMLLDDQKDEDADAKVHFKKPNAPLVVPQEWCGNP
ncbi:hypothetical protein DMN91_007443, partial [Ooceraea biroi]